MGRLRRFFNIREGEGKPVSLFLTYSFFFGAALTVSKVARDAYFLSRYDRLYLSLMFLPAAIAVVLAATVYNWLSRQIGWFRAFLLSGLTFAATLFLIQFRLEGAIIPFLYVWVEVVTEVTSVQLMLLAVTVFNPREAKRLLGIILSGGYAATFIIGAGITPFIRKFGTEYLLSLSTAFILCCVMMAWLVKVHLLQGESPEPAVEEGSGESAFFSSYFQVIAIAIGAAAVTTVILEYQFLMLAGDFYTSEDALTSFIGIFRSATGIVSLLVQVFLTGWFLNRFDILRVLLFLPMGLGIGSVAILANPMIVSSSIARFVERVAKSTVNKTSLELLWVPVAPHQKQNRKMMIDSTAKNILQGSTGAAIFLVAKVLSFPHLVLIRALSLVTLTIVAIWAVIASWLQKGYVSALMSAIEKRRFDFRQMQLDVTDRHIVDTVENALKSGDEAQQIFVLESIEGLDLSPWKETLTVLLREGSPNLQARILELSVGYPDIAPSSQLEALILTDGAAAKDAVIASARRGLTNLSPVLWQILEDTGKRLETRAAAAVALGLLGQEPLGRSRSFLQDLLASGDEARCILGLRMIRHLPNLMEDMQIQDCLGGDSVAVCRATLDIARQRGDAQFIPGIIRCMEHPGMAPVARKGLSEFPELDVVPALCHICVQPETPARLIVEISRTLGDYTHTSSVICLVRMISQSPPPLQLEAALSLLRIARQMPLSTETLARLRDESEKIARDIYARYEMLNVAEADGKSVLLRDLFNNDISASLPVLFVLLLIDRPEAPIETYLSYIDSGQVPEMANLIEILENTLSRKESKWIVPLLRPTSVRDRSRAGRSAFRDLPGELDHELLRLLQSPNPWRVAVAMDYILQHSNRLVLERVDWMSYPDHGLPREVISHYLSRGGKLLDNLSQFPLASFLPTKEDAMLSVLEKTIHLKSTDLFEGVSGEEIHNVAQVMEEKRLNKGDVLFREGDRGDYFYIVVTGEILIESDEMELERDRAGEYFGEMALLDDDTRSGSAIAVEETLLLRISQDHFEDYMMPHKAVRRGIMRALSGRLRRRTERYVELQRKLERESASSPA